MKTYYIYALKEPDDEVIRYIGMTYNTEKRFKEHIRDKNKCYKSNWIQYLISNNRKPLIEVIEDGLTLKEAYAKEISYIKLFKSFGANLVNLTIGGEAPMANKIHSDATKLKMSEVRKGEMNSFYGKKHTEESRKKMSESLNGRESWAKGKRFSEEHRKALCKPKSKHVWNKNTTRFNLPLMEGMLQEGLSQSEVAKYFNTDQGTVSKYIKKHFLNIK